MAPGSEVFAGQKCGAPPARIPGRRGTVFDLAHRSGAIQS